MIRKIAIRNYRTFRSLDLPFTKGTNILVGRNDSGKSTLIEAIYLALTGRIHNRPFAQELSPYLINSEATNEYVDAIRAKKPAPPPDIIIDLFIEETEGAAVLRGTNNLFGEDACGIRIQAKLSPKYESEYKNFIGNPESVKLVPTEYYNVEWLGFSGGAVSYRSIPASASVIDSTAIRLQSGVDFHLQEIIREQLTEKQRVELTREYRSLREEFDTKDPVKKINEHLSTLKGSLADRAITLGIDISQRYTWENNLAAHLDNLPFQFIGKGDQNAIKTLLAIKQRADDSHVVLIEEPETHLSHTSLRKLISRIEERCAGKQLIIATHSNYVLNKLGLQNLVFLSGGKPFRISDIPEETADYFRKLEGYDTLRLVLADAVILVEGPSDELIVQRAYKDAKNKLPIEDGIDVISVGLAHKRFLDLAIRLKRRVSIVRDNDHMTLDQVKALFAGYLDNNYITLHTGNDPKLNTLEPQIVAVNNLDTLNRVLGTECSSKDQVLAIMKDKTGSALKIFSSQTSIVMPEYIRSSFAA